MPFRYVVRKGPLIDEKDENKYLGSCCLNTSGSPFIHDKSSPSNVPCALCNYCEAITANGTPCKLRTCRFSDYCWIHLRSLYKLKIAPSSIPNAGMGLFARGLESQRVVFRPGEFIGPPISGEIFEKQELDKRYDYIMKQSRRRRTVVSPSDPYGLPYEGNFVLSADCMRNAPSYANDPLNRRLLNSEFVYDEENAEIRLQAMKLIHDQEEIFVSYGPDYFKGLWGRNYREKINQGEPPQLITFETKRVKGIRGIRKEPRQILRTRWKNLRQIV